MTHMGYNCEVRTDISTKETKKTAEKLKYKGLDGTDTLLGHACSLTLLSKHCFLRTLPTAKCILIDRKNSKFVQKLRNLYLFLYRLCTYFVVVIRKLYVKLFINVLEYI